MRTVWAAACCVVMMVGCAGTKSAGRNDTDRAAQTQTERPDTAQPQPSSPGEAQAQEQQDLAQKTYQDVERRFEIQRPDDSWNFRTGAGLSTESIEVPVVIASSSKGAQVIVQVAPAVATPTQFAERLTVGLQSRAGFETSEVQPIPLAEGAVGFDFDVADEVHGRVAILEGGEGRVYVLLATWPQAAPAGVERDVDAILASMKPGTAP